MNQTTIDLAANLLGGDCLRENSPKIEDIDFSHMANELLEYFYDCNTEGALDYEKLKGRCQMLVFALEDAISVYRASHSEAD